MKKLTILSILLLAIIFSSAQTVIINEKGFFINDVNVSANWSLSEIINALGKADSTTSGVGMANKTYYYNKGIILWEPMENKKPTEKIKEVQINYVQLTEPALAKYKTKETFSGKVSIDKLNLIKYISAGRLKNALKTWTPEKCYFEHGYKYSNGIVGINFGFNTEETELLWIDIVPATKD